MKEIYQLLDSQDYRITFSPTEVKNNLMMYCNHSFIGGIFEGKLCLLYTEEVAELLGFPEPVYYGYSKNALHKLLEIPKEKAVIRGITKSKKEIL